jgi:hypothetical protein
MSRPLTCQRALLALSDERDLAMALRLAAWREGYRAGRAAGIGEGRRLEAAEREADWRAIARPVARSGELDRRRYPPDGRAGWLLPGKRGAQ